MTKVTLFLGELLDTDKVEDDDPLTKKRGVVCLSRLGGGVPGLNLLDEKIQEEQSDEDDPDCHVKKRNEREKKRSEKHKPVFIVHSANTSKKPIKAKIKNMTNISNLRLKVDPPKGDGRRSRATAHTFKSASPNPTKNVILS